MNTLEQLEWISKAAPKGFFEKARNRTKINQMFEEVFDGMISRMIDNKAMACDGFFFDGESNEPLKTTKYTYDEKPEEIAKRALKELEQLKQ